MKHERFSHLKKTLNKSETNYGNSPIGFINFNKNEFQVLVVNLNDKNENNEYKIENINKNNENNNISEIGKAFE